MYQGGMARIPGTTFHDSDPPEPKPPKMVAGFPQTMVFEDGKMKPASEWKREGKPEWPHYLVVKVDRRHALDMIRILATTLQDPEAKEVLLTFAGEMSANE